jgi:hypothetical protein
VTFAVVFGMLMAGCADSRRGAAMSPRVHPAEVGGGG